MKKVVIYGNGPFAELMHYYFETDSPYQVVAFTADKGFIQNNVLNNLPVFPFETIDKKYDPLNHYMFVAIGYKKMRDRKVLFNKAQKKGYRFVNYMSSSSVIFSNSICGENNVFMPNVIIEPFVKVENNNVFWSKSLVCHHSSIGNHNYMAPGCILSGHVKVEDLCFLGTGTVVVDNLVIRNETYAVAGSVLLGDTQPYTRYQSSPAKPVSQHHRDGIKIV